MGIYPPIYVADNQRSISEEMIGVDIIETKRIRLSIERFGDRFLNKIFTKNEIAYCEKFQMKYQQYAGRFAVKEAVAKVIQKGPKNFWLDIEIQNDENGAPKLNLSKRLLHCCSGPIEISLSHCQDYAVGMAMTIKT